MQVQLGHEEIADIVCEALELRGYKGVDRDTFVIELADHGDPSLAENYFATVEVVLRPRISIPQG